MLFIRTVSYTSFFAALSNFDVYAVLDSIYIGHLHISAEVISMFLFYFLYSITHSVPAFHIFYVCTYVVFGGLARSVF